MSTNHHWRPISEAPRDGTQIIGCSRYQDPIVVEWSKHYNDWIPVSDGWFVEDVNRIMGYIKKWMPMPEKYEYGEDELDD